MTQWPRNSICILHVDDEPDFAGMAAEFLEREDERFTVETAASADEGLEHLADDDVDCIVSDYDMPGRNGIEFLETVREDHPDLPFILFTGKGSEEVASEAISSGVTDYLQKDGGTDQYTVLANRIQNAVERTRAQRERQRHLDAIETAQEGISILDDDGQFIYVNEAYADLYGYDPGEMIGDHWELIYREEDVPEIREDILPEVEDTGHWRGTTTGLRADGSTFVEDHVLSLTDHGELICTVRDITDREHLHKKYELVAQVSTDAFWEWDPITDEITRSEEYLSQFGYDPSDIGDDTDWWRERIHPDDRDRVLDALERAVDDPERAYDETYRFRRKDGTYGYVRSRGKVIYDEHGEPDWMIGAHVDITERKEREKELKRERDRRAALFENAPVPVTTGEIHQEDERHLISDVNEAFEDLFGFDAEDVIGRDVADVVVPREERDQHEGFRERTAAGKLVEAEVTRMTTDGFREFLLYSIPYGVEDGQADGWYAWYTDITERKELEEELREKSNLLEQLFEQVPIHLYVKDKEGRHLRVSNDDSPEAQEVLGKTDLELYPESGQGTYEDDIRVIETGEPIIDKEEYVPSEDAWNLTSKVPWYDDTGEVRGLIGVTREITERKEYEQELERQVERLDEFASVVSHDLRNPLNVAEGRLELAQEGCDGEHLDGVADALDRMETLIDDLLTLARQGKSVDETAGVDIAEITENCWENVETAEATLVTETDRTIRADRSRFQRLLENLFRNAVEHGGQDVTITVGALDNGRGFYVADDGQGIPEEEREKVFESGYSTTEDGTGFGLAIVEQTVEAHGWEIGVTDSEDDGVRFEITGVGIGQ